MIIVTHSKTITKSSFSTWDPEETLRFIKAQAS